MHSVTTHVIYWDPHKRIHGARPRGSSTASSRRRTRQRLAEQRLRGRRPVHRLDRQRRLQLDLAVARTDTSLPSRQLHGPQQKCDKGPPYTQCLFDEQLQGELSRFIDEEQLPSRPTSSTSSSCPTRSRPAWTRPACKGYEQVCSNNFSAPITATSTRDGERDHLRRHPVLAAGHTSPRTARPTATKIQLPNGDTGRATHETRFADVALKYMSHEYIEAATDPLVGSHRLGRQRRTRDRRQVQRGPLHPGRRRRTRLRQTRLHADARRDAPGAAPSSTSRSTQAVLPAERVGQRRQSLPDEAAGAHRTRNRRGAAIAGHRSASTAARLTPTAALNPAGRSATAQPRPASPSHTYASAGEYTVTMTPKTPSPARRIGGQPLITVGRRFHLPAPPASASGRPRHICRCNRPDCRAEQRLSSLNSRQLQPRKPA